MSLERIVGNSAILINRRISGTKVPGYLRNTFIVEDNLAYFREIEQRGRALLRARPDHSVTSEELTQPAQLLQYPFTNVLANRSEPLDTAFYTWAHDMNIRYVLQWLMNNARN